MLVSSADDARAPGASKLATLVNHSSARMEKGKKKKGLCVYGSRIFDSCPFCF